MKSKKQIKEMLDKCKRLRNCIPEKDIFGNSNWINLDVEIRILEHCLNKKEHEIQDLLESRLNIVGEDWCDDFEIGIYDWILENAEYDLVTDEDIECFEEKAKKEEQK